MANRKDTQINVVEVVDEKGNKSKPLRSAYSGTIPKGTLIELSPDQVRRAGEIILAQIKEEIAKDTAKAGAFRSEDEPVPLPKTKRFAESFTFRVVGKRTLEFSSDWPTATSHTLGRERGLDLEDKNKSSTGPFPMTWLVKPKVPYARIVKSNGTVIVVSTPNPGEGGSLWVHPGFRRYSFLERGIRKGKLKVLQELAVGFLAQMLSEQGLPKG